MNYPILEVELADDPVNLQYPADHQATADLLNSLETGRSVKRDNISPSELFEVIAMADLTALPANPTALQLSNERRWLAWLNCIAALGTLRLLNDDGTDTQIRSEFAALFAAGTGTRTRLLAIGSQTISRATELELGGAPTAGDVERARSGDY